MVSSVLSLTGIAAVSSYLYDAVTPMQMVSGRKIYAIYNWASIAMAVVATAATIAAFVTANGPILFLGIALLAVSLVASYSIKQLALKASIEKDAATLQDVEKGMTGDLSSEKKEVADLKKGLEEKSVQLAQLDKENKSLQAQLKQLQKIPDSLQKQLNSFSKDVGTYVQAAKDSGADVGELESIASTLDKDATDINSLGAVVEQLQKLFQVFNQQNQMIQKEKDALSAQLQAITQANLSLHQTLQQEGNLQDDTQKQINSVYDLINQVQGGTHGRSS